MLLLITALSSFVQLSAAEAYDCPERPACTGCGCRGGTGYRAPNGHCVGFRELTRVCGAEPAKACTFENAPNTGLNRECALAKKPLVPRQSSQPQRPLPPASDDAALHGPAG